MLQLSYLLLQHLGDTVSTLDDLINGKHEYSSKLMSAKRPMIVVGSEALQREDGSAIQRLTQELSAKLKAKSEDQIGRASCRERV